MVACPWTQRWLSTIGLVIMCLSLAAASYVTNITQLALTQGVMYGIGGCLAFTPAIIFTNEWFVKRRGFAFGLVWVCYLCPQAKTRINDLTGRYRAVLGSQAWFSRL